LSLAFQCAAPASGQTAPPCHDVLTPGARWAGPFWTVVVVLLVAALLWTFVLRRRGSG
jgi:hypothetical protein